MVTLTIIHDIEIRVGEELPEDETVNYPLSQRVEYLCSPTGKIEFKIYSGGKNDEAAREHFLQLARSEATNREIAAAVER